QPAHRPWFCAHRAHAAFLPRSNDRARLRNRRAAVPTMPATCSKLASQSDARKNRYTSLVGVLTIVVVIARSFDRCVIVDVLHVKVSAHAPSSELPALVEPDVELMKER